MIIIKRKTKTNQTNKQTMNGTDVYYCQNYQPVEREYAVSIVWTDNCGAKKAYALNQYGNGLRRR